MIAVIIVVETICREIALRSSRYVYNIDTQKPKNRYFHGAMSRLQVYIILV